MEDVELLKRMQKGDERAFAGAKAAANSRADGCMGRMVKLHNRYVSLALLLLGTLRLQAQARIEPQGYGLIAHRGGVVDNTTAENSLEALKKAIERGYDRVEIDVRMSKDSVFIVHHDRNFIRYYGLDKPVDQLTWSAMQKLKGNLGNRVHSLEEILSAARGHIKVMVDLKIPGNDTLLHARLIHMLAQYGMLADGMMIGTEASTDFYRGKIALSCTRQQLEDNMLRPDYHPSHYYLFSGQITADDVKWAARHGIPVVGVINAWAQRGDAMTKGADAAKALLAAGVRTFQIDSMFDVFFL
ncbi:Glycerophosphoryl diester phosphodiesterase family protein [Parapedobacter luteus]|uniref:Glycerophosphoryl diester phosphodiesterase family protein n=1 Tax=Parapedobacter luteus TaxID=623280 RepID=A0A1T5BS72_9SPHI|nr:glycerophosphodiester phosphodiesterase family protein [Parapedobacter luteus]SKB50027.1 Glycerophosphoryl diester phosphodiesterase family protein [Parapedobacter luteus]